MSLYYNTTDYGLQEIDDALVEQWRINGNPKYDYYIKVPAKPADNAVWGNGAWIIPPPVIPETISARQVRLWLIQQGITLAQVDAAIDAIPDQNTRDVTRVEWEYAPYVERAHPMLPLLAQSLGISVEILDQAFIEASSL